jgi:hypothetical protein
MNLIQIIQCYILLEGCLSYQHKLHKSIFITDPLMQFLS